MPKTKVQKQETVSKLTEQISNAQAIFVLAPKSVNPNEATDLKMKLQAVGGEYHVIKNNLFKRALEAAGLDSKLETGQNAIVFVGEKSPEAAKIVKEFIKNTEKAEFRGGFLESKAISANDIVSLANLPSRDQMLAQVLATMNAPVSNFVQVLAGNVRSIVNVIDAYKKQKES